MNEVSCRIFSIFEEPLARKQISPEIMTRGTELPLAKLRNKKERIDWADFVTVMRNLRPHFTDDEYIALGRAHMRSPPLRFASLIARLLFSPMGFYRWFNTPREGVGNQLFTCIVPRYRELSDNEIEIDLMLPEGFEVCWDFFLISIGNMEEMPSLLGLPRSTVTLTAIPQGGRYHVVVPTRVGVFARIWRWLIRPFSMGAAARELKEAHETLIERYEEIETARGLLDRQATQLRTAHTVNELIQRDLDLARTLDTVVRVLVEQAGFAWAEIELSAVDGGEARFARYGSEVAEPPVTRALEARGSQQLGRLAVAPQPNFDRREREELLAFILPTLGMALQNAIYRTGLERLVDQRTAELTQARDELAGTVDQLRDAQSARERFFGNISHEIRTPLSIILLAAADIEFRAGTLLDSRARAGLGAVSDAARKLVRLVDELLLLAAGQEGKLRTNPEPTDMAALVEHLVAAWRPSAEAAGLELSSRAPASLVANVDPVAIERVASNLVSNAVKYTPEGGEVLVELAVDSESIRLSVFDTGKGFGEELESRLFGRFERSSGEHRRKTGTGLGLSLSKQLVEAHGGTIAALARSGGGSELRVLLPASLVHHGVASTVASQLRLGDEPPRPGANAIGNGAKLVPPGLSSGTILLAEDDERLAEMIARSLADEYTVIVAHDGLVALDLVRRHQPELLITDVDMPKLDGIELSRRFRDVTGDRLAPIIILSAILDLGTRVAGLEAGAVDYVNKPFDLRELKARVRAQFGMRELALRLHRAEQLSTLGILTSGLAHELRNPANGVVNAIEPLANLLPDELLAPEHPVAQLIEVIGGCAAQIDFLSRQLLGFRSTGFELELQPAVLGDLLSRAVSLAQGALRGVEVRTEIDLATRVRCAPPLITQALTNLLENAGHAAGHGGWIEVRGKAEGRTMTLEVSDSGPGVPTELRDRVFEPFFTTKPAGIGTGLGLSLARDIVQRHGGSLEIRDRGTRHAFVVKLPHNSAVDVTANAV